MYNYNGSKINNRRFWLLPEIGLVREITLSYRVTREAPGRDPGRRRG